MTNKTVLRDTKRVHLDQKGIHNVGALWKLHNSDYCITKTSTQWKRLLAECLAMLKTLLIELGISFEILIVKKKTNNLISYNIIYKAFKA